MYDLHECVCQALGKERDEELMSMKFGTMRGRLYSFIIIIQWIKSSNSVNCWSKKNDLFGIRYAQISTYIVVLYLKKKSEFIYDWNWQHNISKSWELHIPNWNLDLVSTGISYAGGEVGHKQACLMRCLLLS